MPCTCTPSGGVHSTYCPLSILLFPPRSTKAPQASLGLSTTTLVRKSERPTWHAWALNIAHAVAERADCTRRQVGAVILDAEHRVVATGYNGYAAGRPGCLSDGACPRGTKSYTEIPANSAYVGVSTPCQAIHAEENAILYARRDLRECTLYSTHKPCPNCQRFIKGAGIAMVVWEEEGIQVSWYPKEGDPS